MSQDIRPIPFGRRWIGPGQPVCIIAEIGVNHEGDPAACLRLIEEAARAGADAVKLITVKAGENYAPDTESFAVFSRAELSDADTARAFALARALGLECFSTCGDIPSFEMVCALDPSAWKISSGLITHLPLIRRAAATGKTLLLSTGMSGLTEVARAVAAARDAGARHIGLFQCTSLYPAPPETLHLRSIGRLSREFRVPAGLSDHSQGWMAPALAVAAGASMIEKHFSLDPSRLGFDHRVSLDPASFAEMVAAVRRAEAMLGSADKPVVAAESATKYLRCLAARRLIPSGKILEPADLAVMRVNPGLPGLPPEALEIIPGRRAARDIAAWQPVSEDDLL